ncbi:MAG: hypothetical protein KGL39_56370 [Patescibacteria group bacterium]|nr:hypothetical protein [Patescibacteria group bacterium]
MATSVFVPSYWPFFTTNELRKFDYYYEGQTGIQFSSAFMYDKSSNSMLQIDTDGSGAYKDSWYLQYRPGFGLAEWRDGYPNNGVTNFFTPIGWGDTQLVPGIYNNNPIINPFTTRPLTLNLFGKQSIVYEALLDTFTLRDGTSYTNVLQLVYQQTWGSKTAGARYWMAYGVGPVALDWVAPDANGKIVTVGRYDAIVTHQQIG